jgi:hypothetical protein
MCEAAMPDKEQKSIIWQQITGISQNEIAQSNSTAQTQSFSMQ